MKAIPIKNGIVHIAESKAGCPYCTRHIPIGEADPILQKSRNGFATIKCKGCGRRVGLTSDIRGDTVAFEP